MSRSLKILLIFICNSYFTYSQKATFYFNQGLDTIQFLKKIQYQWIINGVELENHKDTFNLNINYPSLDTLILQTNNGTKRVIITRFYTNHVYELQPVGCCSDINIFDAESLKKYDKIKEELNKSHVNNWEVYDRMRGLYESNEIGKVIFKLKNCISKDSIGGTFGFVDMSYTTGVLLKNDTIVKSNSPLTTGSSGYCFVIKIGNVTSKNRDKIDFETSNIHFSYEVGKVYVFLKVLASFEFRFFNRETLLVSFDYITKELELELN